MYAFKNVFFLVSSHSNLNFSTTVKHSNVLCFLRHYSWTLKENFHHIEYEMASLRYMETRH